LGPRNACLGLRPQRATHDWKQPYHLAWLQPRVSPLCRPEAVRLTIIRAWCQEAARCGADSR
jgi:hypothetical protein